MKRTRILTLAFAVIAATSFAYRDLLASAFEANPHANLPDSVARGKVLYATHCVVCHGPSGHGDGPAAQSMASPMDDLADLPPPPIFPDGVIVYRMANGKNAMPAWNATLSHGELWDLLNYIRSLRSTGKT